MLSLPILNFFFHHSRSCLKNLWLTIHYKTSIALISFLDSAEVKHIAESRGGNRLLLFHFLWLRFAFLWIIPKPSEKVSIWLTRISLLSRITGRCSHGKCIETEEIRWLTCLVVIWAWLLYLGPESTTTKIKHVISRWLFPFFRTTLIFVHVISNWWSSQIKSAESKSWPIIHCNRAHLFLLTAFRRLWRNYLCFLNWWYVFDSCLFSVKFAGEFQPTLFLGFQGWWLVI